MTASGSASTTERTRHPEPERLLYGDPDPMGVLRRCGRTFYAASLILPPATRRRLAVLYAFCRTVDDCGDVAAACDGEAGLDRAARLLDEIEAGLAGRAHGSPIVRRFRALAAVHGVPLSLAHQLVEGVRSDLGPVRVANERELVRYAYRVASTVGLMMCRVLGVPREGDPYAVDLGIAMQLTNIARDVREDARSDRVYLPGEWIDPGRLLAAFGAGADPADIGRAVRARDHALRLAERYYASAEAGMRYLPLSVRPGIRAAARNYRAIGAVIRRDPEGYLMRRAATGHATKGRRTLSALLAAAGDALPLRPDQAHDDRLHNAIGPMLPAPATA